MVKVKIKKLSPDAILPSYAHEGDAGLDFYSMENFILTQGMRRAVSTGISMELPPGYVALVWDKSGLAAKKGITVLGGVMDSHYRGEYKIILYNTDPDDFVIKKGDKIAQVLIQPVETAQIQIVEELSKTTRGEGRFGSTGGSNI